MSRFTLKASQVAVVTGAGSGIGVALVDAFAARGLSVAAIDIDAAALESALCGTPGRGEVRPYRVDVRDGDALAKARDSILRDFGAVDVLCNNAGVFMSPVPVWDQSASEFERVLDVNLGGVANGVRAFMPHMVSRGTGHVVNMASYLGLVTRPGGGNAAYVASKHAIVGLSQVMAEELARLAVDIGVTIVCPGPVATAGFHRNAATYPKVESPLRVVSASEVASATLTAIELGAGFVVLGSDTADFVARRLASLEDVIRLAGATAENPL
jgi:NAD(P)-dependent dehydrogenase (short-subunit alcohol dehydrogenase family)